MDTHSSLAVHILPFPHNRDNRSPGRKYPYLNTELFHIPDTGNSVRFQQKSSAYSNQFPLKILPSWSVAETPAPEQRTAQIPGMVQEVVMVVMVVRRWRPLKRAGEYLLMREMAQSIPLRTLDRRCACRPTLLPLQAWHYNHYT